MRSARSIRTQPIYTFWDYMRNRWPRDAGLRLDHLLLSPALAKRLESAGVDRAVRGKPGASDHAPAWVVLREGKRPAASQKGARKKPRGDKTAVAAPRHEQRHRSARPLLVVDGDSFAHRAYHGLPKSIRMRGGRPGGGAIVGFANFLIRFYLERAAARRAGRLGHARRSDLSAPGVPAVPERPGVRPGIAGTTGAACRSSSPLAALPTRGRRATRPTIFSPPRSRPKEKRKGTAVVASGDRDTFQLASDRRRRSCFPRAPARSNASARPRSSRATASSPKQVPDFIALRGDPSDKLPGAKGIGAVGAAGLIRKYGSLDALLKDGKLQRQADALRLYRRIATMDPRAPLPALRDQKPTWNKAAALARSWELKALAERLEKMAAGRS